MGQALVFGLIGSSALVIGGAIGAYWRVPHQISGVLLAFASGTLISALAFELLPEAVLLIAAVVFGRGVFAQLPEEHLAFPLAFAGGALLASLADTLMPEAFEHGRPWNSMVTAAGFLVSFVLSG